MKKVYLIPFLYFLLVFVSCSSDQLNHGANQLQQPTVGYKVGLETGESFGHEVGDIARDFRVTTIDGNEVTMSTYSGESLLIYFFSTW